MSVYDFDPNQEHLYHHNANNVTNLANGYQAESNYLNRGFSSTNNLDMSVQLTRPTSKTAMLVRQRRAMLEQLSCYLCKGYLIDATTIDVCMDSFCKSCIVVYLRSHSNCPKCGTLIHETNPLSAIRSDKVLQDIVYKLVPCLYDDEMKRRRNFYQGLYALSSDDGDKEGSSGSFAGRGTTLSSEHYGVISHPKPFYKPTDSIDLSIEPQTRGDSSAIYYDTKRLSIVTSFTGSLQQQQPPSSSIFSAVDSQQFKTYLRCPAKLTALQLRKFIAAKFNICKDDTIHLLYLNESLKDEYSLIDVAYIYDWRGIEHMRLFYIIERDLTKMTCLRDSQIEGEVPKTKFGQSIGTSTQTVKRVCIDPHPKSYEENNNNVSINNNTSGRNIRPRNETPSNSSRSTASQSTQVPILRAPIINTLDSNSPKQEKSSKDARFLRSQVEPTTVSTTIAAPSVSLTHSPSNRAVQSRASNLNTYVKVEGDFDNNKREFVVQLSSNVRQLTPYIRKMGDTPSIMAGPTQTTSTSTMTSFTEARTTISNSYKNILDAGVGPKTDTKPDPVVKVPAQMAFSFVTERGVTIVRRLNSDDQVPTASTSCPSTSKPAIVTEALPSSSNTGFPNPSLSGVAQQTTGQDSTKVKVKPVYKPLVDPTKLKSPNFKKFGHTARH